MATESMSRQDKRLREVAEAYRERGYRVTIEPSASQLPAFLRPFRPDAIAESSDESVVIEIRSAKAASEDDDWARLAEVVRQQPGWRLELVLGTHLNREFPETIERPEIEARLEEGLRLSEANMLDAALLITWSATEAALRLACRKQRVDLPDTRPATTIGKLYMEGLISREQYDQLLRCMRLRDAVAHGLRERGLASEDIQQLHRLTQYLLGLA